VLNLKINRGYVEFKKYFKSIPGAKKQLNTLKIKNYLLIILVIKKNKFVNFRI
jgi:hypothetical protein